MKRSLTLSMFLLLTAVTGVVAAEPSLDAMATKLAELRAEVETLSTRVEDAKLARRAEQRSHAAQKADLEFQLQREERRTAQLDAQVGKTRASIAAAAVGGEELAPAVVAAVRELRARIENGLPFKVSERLAEVDALEQKLTSGVLSPQKATIHLWALVEDELRLGRENGLYRQIVELDGEHLDDRARERRSEQGRTGRAREAAGAPRRPAAARRCTPGDAR